MDSSSILRLLKIAGHYYMVICFLMRLEHRFELLQLLDVISNGSLHMVINFLMRNLSRFQFSNSSYLM